MKKYFERYIEIIIVFVMFVLWTIGFALNNVGIDTMRYEHIYLAFTGVIVCFLLSFFKNTYYSLVIILFLTFSFSHPFDIRSIPHALLTALALTGIGIIIHLIRFRPKIIRPKLFYSFVALLPGIIFSGAIAKKEDYLIQLLVVFLCTFAFFLLMIFFTSTISGVSFLKVIYLLTIFSIFIQVQGFTALLIKAGFDFSIIDGRSVNVGWGICNNIGMMLLFTLPIGFYYMLHYKFSYKSILLSLIYSTFTYFSLIVFMSKGAILIATSFYVISIISLVIFLLIKKQTNQALIIMSYITIMLGFLLILDFANSKVNLYGFVRSFIEKLDFKTLNGRKPIYEFVISSFQEEPIFGKGFFGGYFDLVDVGAGHYQWMHSTIFQTMYSCGIIGLIGLVIHLFLKYYYLMIKSNFEKITIFCIFILPGIYGLFDVSYFLIFYMVVFLYLVITTDTIYKESNISLKQQVNDCFVKQNPAQPVE